MYGKFASAAAVAAATVNAAEECKLTTIPNTETPTAAKTPLISANPDKWAAIMEGKAYGSDIKNPYVAASTGLQYAAEAYGWNAAQLVKLTATEEASVTLTNLEPAGVASIGTVTLVVGKKSTAGTSSAAILGTTNVLLKTAAEYTGVVAHGDNFYALTADKKVQVIAKGSKADTTLAAPVEIKMKDGETVSAPDSVTGITVAGNALYLSATKGPKTYMLKGELAATTPFVAEFVATEVDGTITKVASSGSDVYATVNKDKTTGVYRNSAKLNIAVEAGVTIQDAVAATKSEVMVVTKKADKYHVQKVECTTPTTTTTVPPTTSSKKSAAHFATVSLAVVGVAISALLF